jgi:hypothetical protein
MEDTNDDIWTSGFRMFSTSQEEKMLFFEPMGKVNIAADSITISNYLFKPSVANTQTTFTATEIINIDLKSGPPCIRIGDDLIFAAAEQVKALSGFAKAHQIPLVRRTDVWSWILEPFLDTDYKETTDQLLTLRLNEWGLAPEFVFALRQEVKMQMLKYNFDTILWEWVSLSLTDVLRAMRTEYDAAQFHDFYKRAMAIALMEDK